MKKKFFPAPYRVVLPLLLCILLAACGRPRESADAGLSQPETVIPGTWQTASAGYEYYGTIQPEYYVQFTGSEIIYGHLKDGELVPDHSDEIVLLEETSPGRFRVQAETADGTRYTYLTSESDPDVMEYYGSWQEEEYPEAYRGGASLSRCDKVLHSAAD